MLLIEIWYKICDVLFLLFNYNNYICNQNKTIMKIYNTKAEQVILVFNL